MAYLPMPWDPNNPYRSATTFTLASSRYNVSTATPMWPSPIFRVYPLWKNAFTAITISLPSIHGYGRNTGILIPKALHHGKKSTMLPSTFYSTTNVTSTRKWPVRSVTVRWKINTACRLKTGVWASVSNATNKEVPMWTAGWHATAKPRSDFVYRGN